MVAFNISLQRRRADISEEEYQRHWLEPHGPMTSKLPGLRFYVQNHIAAGGGSNALARSLGIDGFAQLAYDSVEARMAAYDSAQAKLCNLDTPLFLGGVSRVVTESDGVQPKEDLAKAIAIIPRVPASGKGGPVSVEKVLELCAGAQQHSKHKIIEQAVATKGTVPFIGLEIDLFLELWFGDADDLVACAGNEELQKNNVAFFHIKPYRFV